MKYPKLGEDVYIPNVDGQPLKNASDINFNYYISSRINGNMIDLDITSKIFHESDVFIRKSCYKVMMGQIEDCVKLNILEHMRQLGLTESQIPESLKAVASSPTRQSTNKVLDK